MATVNVDVNGRSFKIACNDGEDAEVQALAAVVDEKVREVVSMVGQIGDERLLLMAAMLLADDLSQQGRKLQEIEKAQEEAKAVNTRLQAQIGQTESEAADQLEMAAGRIEQVLESLTQKSQPQN